MKQKLDEFRNNSTRSDKISVFNLTSNNEELSQSLQHQTWQHQLLQLRINWLTLRGSANLQGSFLQKKTLHV